MPPKYVKTIQDEILYEYAKLISRSAYGNLERAFITDRFFKFKREEIRISDTIREWEREQSLPKECVYCGAKEELSTDHIIPINRGGDDSADNLVLACKSCNSSKGDKGVFEWLGLKKKDNLHRLVAGKYLKQLLKIHQEKGTLNMTRDDLITLCKQCPLPENCKEWDTVNELTCFCLESVLPYLK
jgi:5-methylcytosine-specific restriction endonuclease McrA